MTKLRKYGRRTIDALLPGGLILSYHRVAEPGLDPWGLSVSPRHFDEHLDVVHRLGRPTRLSQLTDMLKIGKSMRGAVAITFDDGYADNYDNARPLLEKHGVPATIFVVSGSVESERGLWWDELAELLLRPGRLPDFLELPIGGKVQRIELGAATDYREDDLRSNIAARVWQARPGTRVRFYHRLWSLLQPLSAPEQAKLLDQIRIWAGGSVPARASHKTLSAQQVRGLAKGNLIEIGGHTVSHGSLPYHSEAHQKIEIEADKAALEELIGSRPTSFAYPYGDHCPATIRLVKAAGYMRACSTLKGHVRGKADPFLLPRCQVLNCGGEELSRSLFNWVRS